MLARIHEALSSLGREDASPLLLRALAWVLLLHVVSEQWFHAASSAWDQVEFRIITWGATLLAGVFLVVRRRGPVFAALAALLLWYIALRFPRAGNHVYLEFFLAALLATFPTDSKRESDFTLGMVRWMVVLVFFWSGVQKLFRGLYLDGSFLSYQIGMRSTFQDLFGFLLSDAEMARILGLGLEVGAGPFASSDPRLLFLSNASWMLELSIPFLLLFRRTRRWGLGLLLVTVVLIEAAAREFYFGVLYTAAAFLFVDRPWPRWVVPAVAVVYLSFVLVGHGIVPGMEFH